MKKIICTVCGQKRGRRQCPLYKNKYICGQCCSSIQMSTKCPENCIHLGKLDVKNSRVKIRELLDEGAGILEQNPCGAIQIYDRILQIEDDNVQALIGKGSACRYAGRIDEALKYLSRAYALCADPEICINIAAIYRAESKYSEAVDMLNKVSCSVDNWKADYLMGECLFMMGMHEKAAKSLIDVIANQKSNYECKNKSRITLTRIYICMRDYDRAAEYAQYIDEEYGDEKINLIESIYLESGRIYELLKLLDSIDEMKYEEKYMLLQCALAINKNTEEKSIAIIDDLLLYSEREGRLDEDMGLVSLKIILLFKQLKLGEAYELFLACREGLMEASVSNQYCKEACHLVAFFIYNIDKDKSIEIYSTASGMELDGFIIGELYNAFSSLGIAPYVQGVSIQKSIQLLNKGKSDSFNRILIAADTLFETGEYCQAYELYRRLLGSDRQDMVLMNKMASCLMKQGKFAEALDIYRSIISNTKFIPSVSQGIIRCCIEQGIDWTGYYRDLEVEKLNFIEIYELAGRMKAAGHFDKAGYLYSYMLDKFSNMDIYSRKMIYHNMASVYRKLNEYKKGIEIIKQIPTKYMGEDLHMDLGCLYCDSGEYELAGKVFGEVFESPAGHLAYFNQGILNMKLKQYDAALNYLIVSKEKSMSEAKGRKPLDTIEYGAALLRLYKNISLCLIKLGRMEEALSYIEKAGRIDINDEIAEVTFIIQKELVNNSRGILGEVTDIDHFTDSTISIEEDFYDDINRLLDSIILRLYGRKGKWIKIISGLEEDTAGFIRNEKRIYSKHRESIERSEGTFQRYLDNLMDSFEKKVILEYIKETAAALDGYVPDGQLLDCRRLMELGDRLFETFEFDRDEYTHLALIPYYICIKRLCRYMIYPLYEKNMMRLPAPTDFEEFREIGVFSYKAGDEISYRMDFSFNISCSEYLFEINCHPGLRSRFLDSRRHNMPWEKLLWMISGIRKKWDILDDAKSAALLLLFYGGYRNYLGVGGELKNSDNIIKLAGDLLHLSNERDYFIRSILCGEYEYDCINTACEVKEIASRCIEGLLKIRGMD